MIILDVAAFTHPTPVQYCRYIDSTNKGGLIGIENWKKNAGKKRRTEINNQYITQH